MPSVATLQQQRRLHDAITDASPVDVRAAIAAGADPDGFVPSMKMPFLYWTILHASHRTHDHAAQVLPPLVRALLDSGCSPNTLTCRQENAWFAWVTLGIQSVALMPHQATVARMLTQAGAHLNAVNCDGETPLSKALSMGCWSHALHLVELGATFQGPAAAEHPQRALYHMIRHLEDAPIDTYPEVAQLFAIALQQSPEALNRPGRPRLTLAEAAFKADVSILRALDEAGVDWAAPLSDAAYTEARNSWARELQVPPAMNTAHEFIHWYAQTDLNGRPFASERKHSEEVLAFFQEVSLRQALNTAWEENHPSLSSVRKPRL